MPPIRRYLRITKYSVLECRIYLDNPADGPRWLLNPRDPALPRIIQSVKPLVLPKLREERERTKEKGKKSKSVKDVVVQGMQVVNLVGTSDFGPDDFEVSIYITETSTRHSLLTKSKTFKDKPSSHGYSQPDTAISGSSTSRLGGGSPTILIREESDEDSMNLGSIPAAEDDDVPRTRSRQSEKEPMTVDSESDSSEGFEDMDHGFSRSKSLTFGGGDDKKLALNTSYEGFSIYGRILCLVVSHKGGRTTNPSTNQEGSRQDMMKDWIVSTQAPKEVELD
jgi:hypothetical protein